MTTKQKKTKYVKPVMQVIELRQRAKLLVGSGLGDRGPYIPDDNNPFNP